MSKSRDDRRCDWPEPWRGSMTGLATRPRQHVDSASHGSHNHDNDMPSAIPPTAMSPVSPLPSAAAATTPPRSPKPAAPRPNHDSTSQRLLPPSPPRSPGSSAATLSSAKLHRDVRRVLQAIRRLHHGRAPTEQRFRLSSRHFAALQDAVFSDHRLGNWARDKLHWAYNAHTAELTLRMAGPLHEKFVRELEALLMRKLTALRDQARVSEKERALLHAISLGGSPNMKLGDGNQRAPDVSFLHAHARSGRPPFVAEVAVAQDGTADFAAIAEEYLLGTGGKIRTFLGVDIEYHAPRQPHARELPRRARIYVWEFQTQRTRQGDSYINTGVTVARRDEDGVEFHNNEGVVDPTATVSFPLRDFCPRKKSDDPASPSPTINITHQELADVLAMAEDAANKTLDDKPAADLGTSDDDDMPSPDVLQYRHNKRSASTQSEHDTEPDTPEGSSFDGKPVAVLEPRMSLSRRAKKRAHRPTLAPFLANRSRILVLALEPTRPLFPPKPPGFWLQKRRGVISRKMFMVTQCAVSKPDEEDVPPETPSRCRPGSTLGIWLMQRQA
ncbi:hypothetical protein P153DRAFT_401835 [Dothidotthia symphoricarpi CBS 119687]|uniref:Uncharacterized protein n=1 Tax=Dothidotthia symphoricarpi CBS 119687 TaxID=1392245 RepID=A0A6A5ZXG1_9PLEO|nr:uncharacterized protein P153DRAFT_401835 [Dothidotthia symphoricarpi CBS 119687]KAF2123593.1 hypothetical protein P153DRAFT_401835 [Dothidotthia symphoricarpi CBS 119687]